MSALVPNDLVGFVHGDAEKLADKLRDGDGIHWAGDPRLSLHMGVIENKRLHKIVARRYEVWRTNEDGTETMIGHWLLEEFDRILIDVAAARMDSPNHVSVEDRIDKANEAIEAQKSAEFRDSVGEGMEHAAKLWHDTNNPRNVFRGIPGLRDEKPVDLVRPGDDPIPADVEPRRASQ